MMKIWEKHFLGETIKVFLLIITCFYGLYILIDYSSHSYNHLSHVPWIEVLYYYFREFVLRLDVFIPFALLIACIKTLTQLNTNNELVALMASGMKLKTLLRPFVFLGLLCTALIYLNTQFLLPQTLKDLRHVRDAHTLLKNKKRNHIFVQSVALKNRSTLLFQEYDASKEMFFDAYWIKTFDEIYRIKYLYPYAEVPSGKFVDHLVRNKDGKLEKAETFTEHTFPKMKFSKKVLLDTIIPPEELSYSKLWKKLPKHGNPPNEKESEMIATFSQKLVIPWLCLLAVIGPAPFCVRFSRYFPIFFIYALSIFGLVACYLIIEASVVLASRQVIPPHWAIGLPFFLVMGTFLWRYVKLK